MIIVIVHDPALDATWSWGAKPPHPKRPLDHDRLGTGRSGWGGGGGSFGGGGGGFSGGGGSSGGGGASGSW